MRISTIGKLILALVITAAGLYFFLKDVDVKQLVIELKSVSIPALIVSSLLLVLSLYLRAIRWQLILPEISGTNKKFLFSNVTIGFMVNNLLPARLGEAVRIVLLWQKNHFPASICIGSVILERIIDLLLFMSFFALASFILPQCASFISLAFIFTSIVIGSIICAFIYVHFPAFTHTASQWFLAKIPSRFREKIARIGRELSATLTWLNAIKKISMIVCLSILIGLCYAFLIMLLAQKTSFQMGILESMFAQSSAAFGAAIPLSPGYVGTLHAVMLQGLTMLGMEVEQARALIIVYHAINYLLINILGLYFLVKLKLSLRELFATRKKLQE